MDASHSSLLVILDEEVNTTLFACDLGQCKGACCTLKGGAGAPVTEEECVEIERALPAALPYLSERSRAEIAKYGFVDAVEGALHCIDERDCVFVYRDEGIAKCSLEKAFHEGTSTFRKPISCHLFPIRRSIGMYEHLRVEHFPECNSGYKRGEVENIPLLSFAKDALVRAYGNDWYDQITSPPGTES